MRENENQALPPILLVEQRQSFAEELSVIIRDAGYQVQLASSAEQCLQLIRREKPALVITGVDLPDHTGYDLCRAIKDDPDSRRIPVVLLASLEAAEDVILGLQCGADNVLVPSATKEYIHSRLKHIIANSRLRDMPGAEQPLEITFANKKYRIGANRLQILKLLLSTFEAAVQKNRQLADARAALQRMNEELEQRVAERTAALTAEISERQRVEAALRAREERFRSLLQHSMDVVALIDRQLHIRYLSPAVERVLGYTPEELLGRSVLTIVHADDMAAAQQRFEQLAQEPGHAVTTEYRARHKDGSWRYIEAISANELHNSAVESIVFNIRDITERKRREAAEHASGAKSEFLSRISHELRTPLNAILGFAQLFEMDRAGLTEEHLDSIRQISRAGQHLLSLIDEVLELSRIEAGRLSLSLEPVLLDEVLEEALSLVRPLARQHGIEIIDDTSHACPHYAMADRQRIKQVFLNLLSNAIKYNRRGGSVEIRCEQGPQQIRISIEDSGPGLTTQQMSRLFVPFERLGAEQTAVEGTGLGLALSKALVEAMHGTLGVASTSGEGSCFWIELERTEAPLDALTEAEKSYMPVHQAETASKTILYIEDNLSNLKLVERILARDPSVRLLSAMQGSIGLDLAGQHQPDIILLDLNLPDLTGAEVLRHLKDDPGLRDIPVVVISADATSRSKEALSQAGARAYLTKPINVKHFLQLLEEILHGAEPRA